MRKIVFVVLSLLSFNIQKDQLRAEQNSMRNALLIGGALSAIAYLTHYFSQESDVQLLKRAFLLSQQMHEQYATILTFFEQLHPELRTVTNSYNDLVTTVTEEELLKIALLITESSQTIQTYRIELDKSLTALASVYYALDSRCTALVHGAQNAEYDATLTVRMQQLLSAIALLRDRLTVFAKYLQVHHLYFDLWDCETKIYDQYKIPFEIINFYGQTAESAESIRIWAAHNEQSVHHVSLDVATLQHILNDTPAHYFHRITSTQTLIEKLQFIRDTFSASTVYPSTVSS